MQLFARATSHFPPASQPCAFASLAWGHCGINQTTCALNNSIGTPQGAGGWKSKLPWHKFSLPLIPSLVLVYIHCSCIYSKINTEYGKNVSLQAFPWLIIFLITHSPPLLWSVSHLGFLKMPTLSIESSYMLPSLSIILQFEKKAQWTKHWELLLWHKKPTIL